LAPAACAAIFAKAAGHEPLQSETGVRELIDRFLCDTVHVGLLFCVIVHCDPGNVSTCSDSKTNDSAGRMVSRGARVQGSAALHHIRPGHIRGFARSDNFGRIARFSSHPRLIDLVRAALVEYGQRLVDIMAEQRRVTKEKRIAFEVADVEAAHAHLLSGQS
jgi:hypothetical protein